MTVTSSLHCNEKVDFQGPKDFSKEVSETFNNFSRPVVVFDKIIIFY